MRAVLRNFYRAVLPGTGLLGAGLAAAGALYDVKPLTFFGSVMAGFSSMVLAVGQAVFEEKLSEASIELLRKAEESLAAITGGSSYARMLILSSTVAFYVSGVSAKRRLDALFARATRR
jgi:hypothetical protein